MKSSEDGGELLMSFFLHTILSTIAIQIKFYFIKLNSIDLKFVYRLKTE